MKKILATLLAMVLLLTACGSKSETPAEGSGADKGNAEVTTASKELTIATNREVSQLDYVVTALASDHEINANLVDGLLEHDSTGHLVGALAEKWESNEDKTVWTFHLRPDLKWVTNTTEEYAPVTAEDFATGIRHGAEFESGTSYILQGVLKGYSEYLKSDFSDDAWSKVGVKALDESTIEYTLEQPTPYFDSLSTYSVLYPVNKDFLESKGAGCKLGSPDKDTCEFGTVAMDSILYNGGYILTTNDAKSKAVLTKNEAYWDAEHVYEEVVTRIYSDGSDPYSSIKGFEQGIYPQASLNSSWEDYDTYLEKYKENAHYDLPNESAFGIVFNYNRQKFDLTNYASDTKARDNTRKAILNEDFRKALRASVDPIAYLGVSIPEDLAKQSIRNINNFPEAGTQSDGTQYFDAVTKAYNEATGENRNLNDGEVAFFSKDDALAYIEKAKKAGVTFPVHLDMLVTETSDLLVKKANALKNSVNKNTDGQIVIELVLESEDVVHAVAYENQDPAQSDYDISTFTGWGPDYNDPKSFVDIYSPVNGYYMTSIGLGTVDKEGKIQDEAIKKQIGLMEYEKLYREADKIVDDMDARYQAFAKADAYLIEKAIFIPTSQNTRFQLVGKYVPFTVLYSPTGLSSYKYKGIRLQENIVTAAEYEEAKKNWEASK